MQFGIVSLFPEMFTALTHGGVTARAIECGLVQLHFWNPRDFSHDKHRRVDDRPYGGGPGMVMQVQPVRAAIQAARAFYGADARVIYLSPQGRRLNQAGITLLARDSRLILLAGRYEGIDERVIQHDVDEEWSIGDYVLSGGELAAMVLIDAVTRQLPGALGDAQSAQEDSFCQGLLDYPHYSRPACIDNQAVPDVLLNGHHAEIARWRLKQALGRTWLRRADLLAKHVLTPTQQTLLAEFIGEFQQRNTN
ncbi:tRNA (guanosine(37)-N1)-methyltransferase TrmD [Thioflexithrix psekupsensis]|uniref:tRNA (guanine-N(1)-)-methyltransferase n=1 Tax=Thioflexithrix psekupsensis TaxID=1570016 RepID=A0A251X520_9GAMM|nr:tRNA (guanosine(37)-N1)-methyltransferase TrmD [Thioflexithrix psekupsensis]OUD12242.1 tRNA (guanosine(37)-N1)-methyltransferase TrmD [Thioflexithrix psekupsensis]